MTVLVVTSVDVTGAGVTVETTVDVDVVVVPGAVTVDVEVSTSVVSEEIGPESADASSVDSVGPRRRKAAASKKAKVKGKMKMKMEACTSTGTLEPESELLVATDVGTLPRHGVKRERDMDEPKHTPDVVGLWSFWNARMPRERGNITLAEAEDILRRMRFLAESARS